MIPVRDAPATVEAALKAARLALAHLDSEAQDALLLLGKATGHSRESLLAHPEWVLSENTVRAFEVLVAQRAAGTPLPYLLGTWWFYGRSFEVSPAVLIPRPETEELVEISIEFLDPYPGARRVLDVGAGSGVIAISLAQAFPDAEITGVDLSPAALRIAESNAARLGAEQVRWLRSDLLESVPVPEGGFSLIAANLPYIPTADLAGLAVARDEPGLALDGGPDGLDLIRRLLESAPAALAADGMLLLEIEERQGRSVVEMARSAFRDAEVRLRKDLAGKDRFVSVRAGAQRS